MNKICIISFSKKGGIKHFTDFLIDKCFSGKDILILNSNNFFEIYKFIKKNKNKCKFIFTNNNMKIYYLFFLGLKFKSILILHDHQLRKKPTLREKILNFLVFKMHKKFEKIIIHKNDKNILKRYDNFCYADLPFHIDIQNTKNLNNKDKKIKLLFFGRIVPYKNIEFLVNVFENLSIRNKYELIIAGEGKISRDLLIKIEKNNSISLINQYVDFRLKNILFNWCDFLILPYNSVTQTGLINEAAFYSKPVIISNIKEFQNYKSKIIDNVINIDSIDVAIISLNKIYEECNNKYDDLLMEVKKRYEENLKKWSFYKKILLEGKNEKN